MLTPPEYRVERSARGRCLVLAAVALALHLSANFLRGPSFLLHPALAFEDGRELFGFYYTNRDLAALFRSYAGYVSLGPNLFGYLFLGLSPGIAATTLALFPWVLNAVAFSLFVLPPWRAAIESDRLRFGISLALGALPLQDFGMVMMTMYSLWSLLLIQCALAVLPAPKNNLVLWSSAATQVACAWSNPLSILLAPLYLAPLVTKKFSVRESIARGLPILGIVSHFLVGTDSSSQAVSSELFPTIRRAADVIVQRVFFETLASSTIRVRLAQHGLEVIPQAVGTLALLACCVGGLLAWRRGVLSSTSRYLCLVGAYLILTATLVAVLARGSGGELLETLFGQRYIFVQRVVLIAAIACVFADWVRRAEHRIPSRWVYASGTAVLLHLALLNVLDRRLYQFDPEEHSRAQDFTTRLRAAEARGTRDEVRLDRGEWSVVVRARARQD